MTPDHVFIGRTAYRFDVVLTVTDEGTTNPPVSATTTQSVTVTPAPAASITGWFLSSGAASFSFVGSTSAAGFSCRLRDADAWTPCSSPKLYGGLGSGEYRFSVREERADGELEPSPPVHPFVFSPLPLPQPLPQPLPYLPGVPTYVPPISSPVPSVRVPRPARVPKVPRAPRLPGRPSGGRAPDVHEGPSNVFTPADVVVGARKNKSYGCEDKNPNHPENVSHCGWPRVTGMFFNTGETQCDGCPTSHTAAITIIGTKKLNDLLLGGRGNVTIITYGGNNVLWADRVPGGHKNKMAQRQKAKITAGDGNNIVYAGPGTNTIKVGKGRNVIHAWQGRGSVTCRSRKSVVRMMDRSRKRYKIRGCSTARGY